MNKKTVVIGASENPERYSYLAVMKLCLLQHEVIAIGKSTGHIGNIQIINENPVIVGVHTITLYINPILQKEFYNYILSINPKRIIFNPGAENNELFNLAKEHNIEPINACTLVLLSTGMY